MSIETQGINRRIRQQAASKKGKSWSDADRLTNVYLLLEMAGTILEEYDERFGKHVREAAGDTLSMAIEAEESGDLTIEAREHAASETWGVWQLAPADVRCSLCGEPTRGWFIGGFGRGYRLFNLHPACATMLGERLLQAGSIGPCRINQKVEKGKEAP